MPRDGVILNYVRRRLGDDVTRPDIVGKVVLIRSFPGIPVVMSAPYP